MVGKFIVVVLLTLSSSVLSENQPLYPWYIQKQQHPSPATTWTNELIRDPHADLSSPFAPYNIFPDRRALHSPGMKTGLGVFMENTVDMSESPNEIDWEVTYQKSLQNQITAILGLVLRAIKRFVYVFNPFSFVNRSQLLIDSITSVRTAYSMVREIFKSVAHVISFLLRNGVLSMVFRSLIIFVPAITKGVGSFIVNFLYFARA